LNFIAWVGTSTAIWKEVVAFKGCLPDPPLLALLYISERVFCFSSGFVGTRTEGSWQLTSHLLGVNFPARFPTRRGECHTSFSRCKGVSLFGATVFQSRGGISLLDK